MRISGLARTLLSTALVAVGIGLSPATRAADDVPSVSTPVGAGHELVLRSLSLIGVRYRLGGTSPATGLDCSGLVQTVFRETLGLALPRRSVEMSREGTPVTRDRLQPGDLVFFNTLRRAFSHVGIYIGENRFVHAPSSGGRVRVEALDSRYWARRFNGARRITDEPASRSHWLQAGAARLDRLQGRTPSDDAPDAAANFIDAPAAPIGAGATPALLDASTSLIGTIYAY